MYSQEILVFCREASISTCSAPRLFTVEHLNGPCSRNSCCFHSMPRFLIFWEWLMVFAEICTDLSRFSSEIRPYSSCKLRSPTSLVRQLLLHANQEIWAPLLLFTWRYAVMANGDKDGIAKVNRCGAQKLTLDWGSVSRSSATVMVAIAYLYHKADDNLLSASRE